MLCIKRLFSSNESASAQIGRSYAALTEQSFLRAAGHRTEDWIISDWKRAMSGFLGFLTYGEIQRRTERA